LKIEIVIEDTRITLSAGSEGVTIDAPEPVGQEMRQTTLSEAQWAAYAQGRKDERTEWLEREKEELDLSAITHGPSTAAVDIDVDVEHHADTEGRTLGDIIGENNLPPKVDPVTGDIAGWVKTYRTERRKRAIEAQPRAVCVSTCCGTEGARTRDGSCWGCR